LKKNRQEDDLGEVVFAGSGEMVLPLSQEEKERSHGLHMTPSVATNPIGAFNPR